jgi:hypothetical protein
MIERIGYPEGLVLRIKLAVLGASMGWIIGGYFALIAGTIALMAGTFLLLTGQKTDNGESPIGIILTGFPWIIGGLWALTDHLLGKTGYSFRNTTEMIIVAITIALIVMGMAIIFVKLTRSKTAQSFAQKLLIASVSATLASLLSYLLGIGEGIKIISLGIGSVIFITVSIIS